METTTTTPTTNTDAGTQDAEVKTDTGLAATKSDPVAGTEVKDAAREAIRKHKLKVAGQEIEVDDDELKRGYSMSKAAQKELQDAVRMRKQSEQFITMMKDPEKLMDALTKLGHDPRKLSETYLARILEEEVMDPKDRELKQLKSKLQEKETAEQKRQEEIKLKRDEIMTEKFKKEYEDQFVEALHNSKLPRTKETIGDMAKYVGRFAKIGVKITAQEAAKLVEQDLVNRNKSIYENADAETLVRMLGEDTVNKLRGWDTNRLKDPTAGLRDTQPAGEKRDRKDSPKRLTPHEWRRLNRGF